MRSVNPPKVVDSAGDIRAICRRENTNEQMLGAHPPRASTSFNDVIRNRFDAEHTYTRLGATPTEGEEPPIRSRGLCFERLSAAPKVASESSLPLGTLDAFCGY